MQAIILEERSDTGEVLVNGRPYRLDDSGDLVPADAIKPAEQNEDPDATKRGIAEGIAMSIAFMLRRGCETQAQEWWHACGLTVAELQQIGVEEYDLDPIREAGLDDEADAFNLQGSGPAPIEPREG